MKVFGYSLFALLALAEAAVPKPEILVRIQVGKISRQLLCNVVSHLRIGPRKHEFETNLFRLCTTLEH